MRLSFNNRTVYSLNRKLWMTAALTATFLFFPKSARAENQAGSSPKVRVRIATIALPLKLNSSDIQIQGLRLADIDQIAFIKNQTAIIENKKIGGARLWFLRQGENLNRTAEKILKLTSSSGKIKIGIHQYPSPVYLSAKNSKSADLMISLSFEKYLEGVLIGEMPPTWPLEALKAQAIAARTYTLFQLAQREDEVFQLDGNVLDQVYSAESTSSLREKIRTVLESTKDMVLVSGKSFLKAYYHSDCGGETEDPTNVWGSMEVKFGTTKDQYCKYRASGTWIYKISKDDLAEKLGDKFRIRKVEDIQITMRTPSRRAALIAMAGGGERLTMSGQEVRQLIGFDKIKSTLFSLTSDESSVTFSGRGNGHGSGLCQWGARSMASEGKTFRQILKHYYPVAQLKLINENNGSRF